MGIHIGTLNPGGMTSEEPLAHPGEECLIILGGRIILFLEYLIAGLILCITIIGIPFGIQCMKLSFLALLPFGKEVRNEERAAGCLSTVMNMIWILIGGVWIALTHLIFAVICAIIIWCPVRSSKRLIAEAAIPFNSSSAAAARILPRSPSASAFMRRFVSLVSFLVLLAGFAALLHLMLVFPDRKDVVSSTQGRWHQVEIVLHRY
jgi:uncharacterized membrane protein YccF (DUF307 family)